MRLAFRITLLAVGLGSMPVPDTSKAFTMLMGRNEAPQRRAWLEEHGHEVEADV